VLAHYTMTQFFSLVWTRPFPSVPATPRSCGHGFLFIFMAAFFTASCSRLVISSDTIVSSFTALQRGHLFCCYCYSLLFCCGPQSAFSFCQYQTPVMAYTNVSHVWSRNSLIPCYLSCVLPFHSFPPCFPCLLGS
jgi:hypothetical protein